MVVRAGVAVAAFIATFVGLPAVIAVVIAAAVGFFAVWAIQNWEKIKAAAAATWQFLVGSVTTLWQSVQSAFQTGIGLIAGLWSGVVTAAQAVWGLVLGGAQALWSTMTTVFATGVQIIGSAWTAVLIAAEAIWALVAEGAQALWSALASIWQSGVSIMAGAWSAIAGAAQALWAQIQSTFEAGFQFISQGWQVLVAITTAVFAQVAAIAQAVWTAITSAAQSMWDSVTGFFSAGVSAVIGFLQRVKDFALAVWNAITAPRRKPRRRRTRRPARVRPGSPGAVRLSGPALRPAIPSRSGLRPASSWCAQPPSADMGSDSFHALNAMRLPLDVFRGFSQGGLVERLRVLAPPMPVLRFAEGGLIPRRQLGAIFGRSTCRSARSCLPACWRPRMSRKSSCELPSPARSAAPDESQAITERDDDAP